MRSKFVDKFQHDSQAKIYDDEVKNESDPIRAGYRNILKWVSEKTNYLKPLEVVEFGSGTGSLSILIENYSSLVCVDASPEMTKQAKVKLNNKKNIHFEVCDFFEFLDRSTKKFDVIISTYALHHLTDPEKELFLEKAVSMLQPNGQIIIGDLMFFDDSEKRELIKHFTANNLQEIVEDIDDEFFWDISKTRSYLENLNFVIHEKRFSMLSWGIIAKSSNLNASARTLPV